MQATTKSVAPSPRGRLRLLLLCFTLLLGTVYARAWMLELTEGPSYREELSKPIEQTVYEASRRGQILDRNDYLLAFDKPVENLAISYRLLQDPPDPRWLHRQAVSRLSRAQRKNKLRLAQEKEAVLQERARMQLQLAEMCGLSEDQWRSKTRRIQYQVEAISNHVNQRRRDIAVKARTTKTTSDNASAAKTTKVEGLFAVLLRALFEEPDSLIPPPIAVAEELQQHVVVEDISPQIAETIRRQAERFSGVMVEPAIVRTYPGGESAAHLLGYATTSGDASRLNSAHQGIEAALDKTLRGEVGTVIRQLNERGKILSERVKSPARPGEDVSLTIDLQLQKTAESLLDRALRRQTIRFAAAKQQPVGGAAIVIDISNGEILAAASAPRFDPNAFSRGETGKITRTLRDPAHPLFDRTLKMALPPGSVFKLVVAAALMEEGKMDPRQPFDCQGFLDSEARRRCFIYSRYGVGHGPTTMGDALARSCNVYFFHHATRLGPEPISRWAARFGLGRPTGCELADEAAGSLPVPGDKLHHLWTLDETQELAIGQGHLTTTPLQIARMTAAIANGGFLVPLHFVKQDRSQDSSDPNRLEPIPGLKKSTIQTIQNGMRQAVSAPEGTGFRTIRLASTTIAAKTGTAQAGGQRQDHAWTAAYAPAENPQYAFVVALEHGGGGSQAAGPVVRLLVEQMQQLGYFISPRLADKNESRSR